VDDHITIIEYRINGQFEYNSMDQLDNKLRTADNIKQERWGYLWPVLVVGIG